MFYYLYEIRNNLDGKIYVGVHKTKSLDDGYMGSGKVIKRAIEKHGIENFTKTILETFEDSDSMYAREKDIVTEEFLSRGDVYNLMRGGRGGFDHININNLRGDFKEGSSRGGKLGGVTAGKSAFANKTGIHSPDMIAKTRGFKSDEHRRMMSDRAKSPESQRKRIESRRHNAALKEKQVYVAG